MNPDSVEKYRWTLCNSTNLNPNSSRFEGFKLAGKLDLIENDELLNDMLTDYQELIPQLVRQTMNFTRFKENNVQRYLDEHLHRSGDNFLAVMQSDPMYNYLNKGLSIQFITNDYHKVIQQNRRIIREITA